MQMRMERRTDAGSHRNHLCGARGSARTPKKGGATCDVALLQAALLVARHARNLACTMQFERLQSFAQRFNQLT